MAAVLAILALGSSLNIPALRVTRPSAAEVDEFVRRQGSKGFNSRAQGHVVNYLHTGERPAGLQLCERSAVVGRGQQAYDRARNALANGELISGVPWATICLGGKPAEAPDLATVVQCYRSVWCLNPCRVTYAALGTTHSTVAYATLNGHLLEGEEAFDLRMALDGRVHVRVASLSKGSGVLGTLATPFIAPIRRAFLAAAAQSFVSREVAAQRLILGEEIA
ncbi:hypothetical protein T492DRAFT_993015 [Pavlovales sp. CCMP2436]|nr:hypothetical protein T492DRAFT_993015 [Pavlovales sp. CCMP2436]